MSTLLETMQIDVRQPFSANNLADTPDLTIIGNVCTRDHVEVVEVKRKGLAHDSMAGAIERLFLANKKPLVVAGTHGKTTSCSMTAWALEHAKQDPGFMIGGLVQNFGTNCKLGKGPFFVVEGDEYDTAYFDKYPKFMHYRPFGAVITSIEFDHADIFDSLEEIEAHFVRFVSLIPAEGCLAACWDYDTVRRVSKHATCRIESYGQHPDAVWKTNNLIETPDGQSFDILHRGTFVTNLDLPMSGPHNRMNALGVTAMLLTVGYPIDELPQGFATFKGIARRQQVRGVVNGVRVIDDFAHHPTAIRLTLDGLHKRYPDGRLLIAFDPRTNTTSRNIFQKELSTCFADANLVLIGDPSRLDRIAVEDRLNVSQLAMDINATGVEAAHISDIDEMTTRLLKSATAGDTIAILSNGSFGGLHEKVLKGLE